MKPFGILLPLFLLFSGAMGVSYVDISELSSHPMLDEIEESGGESCPSDIDVNGFWMSKFLNLVKDELPHTALTVEEVMPCLLYLAELEIKGWLKAIATGKKSKDDPAINWPDERCKPYIITGFMPTKDPEDWEDKLPVIEVVQTYNGQEYRQKIGQEVRKKRDVNGEEVEELVESKRRAFLMNQDHFDENLSHLEDKPELEIHEDEFDDNGQVIGRKKRETPENMQIWPPPGTYFTAKRLCVKVDENGTIIFPSE